MSTNHNEYRQGPGDAVRPQNTPADPFGEVDLPTAPPPQSPPLRAYPQVGYDLGYLDDSGRRPPATGYGVAGLQRRANGMAVTGMVLGILSVALFWVWFIAPVLEILAVVFNAVGMAQCARLGERGRGMAIAGLVCGLTVFLATILVLVGLAASLAINSNMP